MPDAPIAARNAPSRWRCLVELFALCGFAITQPLLDVFGRAPDQFGFRGATGQHVVLFGLAVALLPALGLWVIELAVGLVSASLRTLVHQVLMVGLVAVIVVQATRSLDIGRPVYLVGIGVGIGVVLAWRRFRPVRMWLRYAALASVGFLGLFLLASPSSALISADPVLADVHVGKPAPVVMIVLDELPLESVMDADGTIDADLYPNLSALAGDSHWFRDATSVSPSTWHAVPAVDTGLMPENGEAPTASDHPHNLFTLLGGSYEMHVTESISRLCPPAACAPESTEAVMRGLAHDVREVMRQRLTFDTSAPDPVAGLAEQPDFGDFDLNQPERFTALLDGLDTTTRALHFLHILLPHVPYRYTPDGRIYEGPNPDFGRLVETDMWDGQTWPTVIGRQRHLLQVQYVDSLLGQVFDRMKELGTYDRSAIVVTADHGISFRPNEGIRLVEGQPLTEEQTPDILWVPLFVKEPGQTKGVVSDANVLTIDILPTIADMLDIDLPWKVDGRSALGPPRSTDDKPWRGSDVGFGVTVTGEVTVDGAAGYQHVLEHSVSHFVGAPGDPHRLYRVGPSPELVGQRVTDVGDRLAPMSLELNDPALYAGGQPPGTVPALVRAHGGPLHDGDRVAVAIDGVVASTGVAFQEAGRTEVAVMVPEALVTSGKEHIAFYRIS